MILEQNQLEDACNNLANFLDGYWNATHPKLEDKNDSHHDATHIPPRPTASLIAHIPTINPGLPGTLPVITTTSPPRMLPSSPLVHDLTGQSHLLPQRTPSQLSHTRYGPGAVSGGLLMQRRPSTVTPEYYRQAPPPPSVQPPPPTYDDERFAHYEMANFR